MTPLIMMYLSFDSNGDIKSISPDNVIKSDNFTTITIPLSEVEGFIKGIKNPFDYYVKVTKRISGVDYKLTRKQQLSLNSLRSLDSYLTEITKIDNKNDSLIVIENLLYNKEIEISAGPLLQSIQDCPETDDETKILDIIKSQLSISLFFTKNKDPYHLLHTMVFSPGMLLNKDTVRIKYKTDLSTASCYTRKLIDGYSYIIRK